MLLVANYLESNSCGLVASYFFERPGFSLWLHARCLSVLSSGAILRVAIPLIAAPALLIFCSTFAMCFRQCFPDLVNLVMGLLGLKLNHFIPASIIAESVV
ncbi:hypothetical protein OUZ56_019947 [Daphnia magna]|uniref:Uncharacterized protein n=1 Tax=Daphnia magna TaxID=35525 RepID=A0ABQ9ZD31_9CRUS|nr:hypothetical protein OUZ56_019947 [Daphnia magna]